MMNELPPLSIEEQREDSTVVFGFWMYVMSDLILFAGLFATYAVLRTNTFGGPAGSALFNLPFVLEETVILLTSSFTCGLALLAARNGHRKRVLLWLVCTTVLGVSFLTLEFSEFAKLIAAGEGPARSGFLSAYFTLVGTHGLHVFVGVLWVLALIISISARGLTRANMRKLATWSLFWHFLEIIWICIFAIVYLLSVI
jgi:cytochrome o ubiquinol oxidase subunit 3